MARDSPLGTSVEEAAALGQQHGTEAGRSEAVRIRIDPKAVSSYADDLHKRASEIEKRRDDIKECGIWMLDGSELDVDGLLRAAGSSLTSAARTLRRSARRTLGLALAYQELERMYPGGGVPRSHWRQVASTLKPKELDERFAYWRRVADSLRDQPEAGVAAGALTTHNTLALLSLHDRLLDARDGLTVHLLNQRLAGAPHKMGRIRLLENWLGVDRDTSRLIAKAFEQGRFQSVYDIMLFVDGKGKRLPADTMNHIFAQIRSGGALSRIPFRAEEAARFFTVGRIADLVGRAAPDIAGRVRYSGELLAGLRRQVVRSTVARVGGRMLVPVGFAVDAATLADPDSTYLSRTSAGMGIGGSVMVVGGGIAATGFGAPVGATVAAAGAVISLGSVAVTAADAWWSSHTEQEKIEAYEAAANEAAAAAFDEQLQADTEAAWAEIEAAGTRASAPARPARPRVERRAGLATAGTR